MTVEELLDQIDDMIDKAWSFPLSGGRCVVDANHLRDIIDDIRGNIPSEVRQAQGYRLRPGRYHRDGQAGSGRDCAQRRGTRPQPDRP